MGGEIPSPLGSHKMERPYARYKRFWQELQDLDTLFACAFIIFTITNPFVS